MVVQLYVIKIECMSRRAVEECSSSRTETYRASAAARKRLFFRFVQHTQPHFSPRTYRIRLRQPQQNPSELHAPRLFHRPEDPESQRRLSIVLWLKEVSVDSCFVSPKT